MADQNSAPQQHLGIFGERIIGKQNADYFQSPAAKQASVFGDRVVGGGKKVDAPAPGAGLGGDANNDGRLSLAEITDLLQGTPAKLDDLIAAERASKEPRKGAWKLFLKVEEAKPEAEQRAELLAELKALAA
jgi:hypothetical protein